MHTYIAFASTSFQKHLAYRINHFLTVGAHLVFAYISVFLWAALFGGRDQVEGFKLQEMITYLCLSETIAAATMLYAGYEIQERIRTGGIATDFMKPINYQGQIMAVMTGEAVYRLLANALPVFIVMGLSFDLRFPQLHTVPFFLLSLFFAFLISAAFRYILGISAFYLFETTGINRIYLGISYLFAGYGIPLPFYPDLMRKIVEVTPFQCLNYIPVSIYLEKMTGDALVQGLMTQAIWSLVLIGIGTLMTESARRKLVVQGG